MVDGFFERCFELIGSAILGLFQDRLFAGLVFLEEGPPLLELDQPIFGDAACFPVSIPVDECGGRTTLQQRHGGFDVIGRRVELGL